MRWGGSLAGRPPCAWGCCYPKGDSPLSILLLCPQGNPSTPLPAERWPHREDSGQAGVSPHPPAMEQVLEGGRECSIKAPCAAPMVPGCLAGAVWILLPASHFREMNVLRWLFIYFTIFFFLPLGVEQQGVCWFINIPRLAERGNPSLIRP